MSDMKVNNGSGNQYFNDVDFANQPGDINAGKPINPSDGKNLGLKNPQQPEKPADTTPTLPQPTRSVDISDLKDISGNLGSVAAQLGALIIKITNEQRAQNRDEIVASTNTAVASIQNQANELRKKATKVLVMGIISGGLQIAGGIASIATFKMSMPKLGATAAASMAQTANSFGTATGGMASSIGQYMQLQHDSKIKEMEKTQTAAQALTDRLKQYNDSMNQLINGMISSTGQMVDNQNQTRARILG